jgi:Protein of unknown function (DUF1203)
VKESNIRVPHLFRCIMSFQLVGLPHQPFSSLFSLNESALGELNIRRVFATTHPGYPCRVGLIDAAIGDELLLLPFEHQVADSPYKASGPIHVRKASQQEILAPDVVPDCVQLRQISVRAYDAEHMMIDASVCLGGEVAQSIGAMFADDQIAYIHLHNAKRGCFSCVVNRLA